VSSDARAPRLELRSASRRFDDGVGRTVLALAPTSLSLERGQCLRVLGPSGAGKSTLLSLACGLLLPTEGEVWLEGEPFSRWREPFRAQIRRRTMGVVVQQLALVAGMSARENVLLSGVPDGMPSRADRARAEELLRALGLEAMGDTHVERLSGGERQRVALARALSVASATLLVLDEPTAHLDHTRVDALVALLRERMQRDGTSVLLSTHDPRLDALGDALHLTASSRTAAEPL
jgi:putative ABC transport system ATP-binding protein